MHKCAAIRAPLMSVNGFFRWKTNCYPILGTVTRTFALLLATASGITLATAGMLPTEEVLLGAAEAARLEQRVTFSRQDVVIQNVEVRRTTLGKPVFLSAKVSSTAYEEGSRYRRYEVVFCRYMEGWICEAPRPYVEVQGKTHVHVGADVSSDVVVKIYDFLNADSARLSSVFFQNGMYSAGIGRGGCTTGVPLIPTQEGFKYAGVDVPRPVMCH